MATRPYIVEQGDYLLKLATRYSFDADAVWALPENQHLKDQGRDPNILSPGDVLNIPVVERRWLPITVGQVNKFVAKPTKVDVCLSFGSFGKPWSGEAYSVEGAEIADGTLDADGKLHAKVSTSVASFVVVFTDRKQRITVNMGHLDPPNTNSGLVQRLTHLGYLSQAGLDENPEVHVRMALMRLQAANKLPVTGEPDAKTWQALADEHGI